jgi:endonuclease/exonuclease/phosphatase family metal-dependent hydrolase
MRQTLARRMVWHFRFAATLAAFASVLALAGCPPASPGGPERALTASPGAPGSTGRDATDVFPSPFRVATWNIAWLDDRVGVGTIARQPEDYDRLARFAAEVFADTHLVMLQEVRNADAIAHVFPRDTWEMVAVEQRGSQSVGAAWRRDLPVRVVGSFEELALATVRQGLDLEIQTDAGPVRLLGVHLKSGCWGENYVTSTRDACVKLRDQLPILESWIDARAAEEIPFLVLGDFNRRLQPRDPFWIEIDDADPPNADLTLVGEGRVQQCWNSRYPEPIDHILTDRISSAWLVPGSEREDVFPADWSEWARVLSDHCPYSVALAPTR